MNTSPPAAPSHTCAAVAPLRRHAGLAAELLLLLVAAAWGSSYAVAKQVLLQVTVLHYLLLRFGLTALLLSPALVAVWTGRTQTQALRSLGVGLALGGILLVIFLCETCGVARTTASNAAFLISLCVVFTPFVEWGLLGRKPAMVTLWAAVACVVGTLLLAPQAITQPLESMGDWLMLAAAVLRALMVTATRRLVQVHPVSALTLTALQSWVVFVGLLVTTIVQHRGRAVLQLPDESTVWVAVGYLVVICTVFAFFAQNYAASRLEPTTVGFLMASEPVFGALSAQWLLSEQMTAVAWLGGALIVVATSVTVKFGGVAAHRPCVKPSTDTLARRLHVEVRHDGFGL